MRMRFGGAVLALAWLMASGAVDVRPLLSAAISLDEAPAWFERLYAHEPGLMKVVVTP